VTDDVPRPARSRLDPRRADYGAIIAAHEAAERAGAPTYLDPSTGYLVMTRSALRARGSCCQQGCRHCPYVVDD
jgi:hypothetical protein